MYNFVKFYVIPIAFALLTVWLWQGGTDLIDAAVMCGLMHVAAQVMLYTLKDIYDSWLDERGERHPEAERPTRHEDITLDDLNALLERIDRGGDDVPDTPLLTTNERRERMTTFYAGNAVYTVIPKPSADVRGVTQTRR